MANYRGTVFNPHKPNATEASRLGHRGIVTNAASWAGSVQVSLMMINGVDIATVELRPHHGNGVSKILYRGPVHDYKPEPLTD